MEKEEILSTIKRLLEEKRDVSKELEEIQKKCDHKHGYDVKFYNGTNEVKNMCRICNYIIGYPSEQDLKDNGFI